MGRSPQAPPLPTNGLLISTPTLCFLVQRHQSIPLSIISKMVRAGCIIFLHWQDLAVTCPAQEALSLSSLEQGKCSATSRHNSGAHTQAVQETACPVGGREAEERKGVGGTVIREGPQSPTSEVFGELRIFAPTYLCSPAGSLVASVDSAPLCEASLLHPDRLPAAPSPAHVPLPLRPTRFYPFWAPAETCPMTTDPVWSCDIFHAVVLYHE